MWKKLLLAIVMLLLVVVATVYFRYGGGEAYPDVTTTPLLPESALEVAVQYPEPIGNVAVAEDGRIFFTAHPEARPVGPHLLVFDKGSSTAFPDRESQSLFETPLGVAIDRQQRLWVIDFGTHGFGNPTLFAFDIDSGKKLIEHEFKSDVAPLGSMLQDLQVSPDGKWVYIADVSFWRKSPGLVVYDVENDAAWRMLDDHPSVQAQDWIIETPEKKMEFFGGLAALKPGVDGIALSRDGEWLYYGAMTHDTLYRVPSSLLRDGAQRHVIENAIENLGPKPLNDGMSTDDIGSVYITDVEHGGVMVHQPDGKLLTLVKSDDIRWADALSFGPDGWLYIADSAIPQMMLRPRDEIREAAPYTIWKLKLPVNPPAGQ
ncbi:MAG: L-dopachrome tautomerase-related protein [Gammaproteobacteria bacterium]|nr:L-dopachrome tautomerase-related protein [Gammaproteobacteria bacterium]